MTEPIVTASTSHDAKSTISATASDKIDETLSLAIEELDRRWARVESLYEAIQRDPTILYREDYIIRFFAHYLAGIGYTPELFSSNTPLRVFTSFENALDHGLPNMPPLNTSFDYFMTGYIQLSSSRSDVILSRHSGVRGVIEYITSTHPYNEVTDTESEDYADALGEFLVGAGVLQHTLKEGTSGIYSRFRSLHTKFAADWAKESSPLFKTGRLPKCWFIEGLKQSVKPEEKSPAETETKTEPISKAVAATIIARLANAEQLKTLVLDNQSKYRGVIEFANPFYHFLAGAGFTSTQLQEFNAECQAKIRRIPRKLWYVNFPSVEDEDPHDTAIRKEHAEIQANYVAFINGLCFEPQ